MYFERSHGGLKSGKWKGGSRGVHMVHIEDNKCVFSPGYLVFHNL